MPNTNNFTETPRKELHIFYVLDTSGSMLGDKISTLNRAMEETVDALRDMARKNGDARLKIAVLTFASNCEWITSNGPEDLEEAFVYEPLSAGGLTDIGSALEELNQKLSRHEFLDSMTGAYMPVIIFMTDGYATDDYDKALSEIRQNRWFARATKIGFAFGDDPDERMISSVVGNSEAVIKTNDYDTFVKLMKFVSVTSSMLVSGTQTQETATSGADVVNQAKEAGIDTQTVKLDDDEYNKEESVDTDDDWDDDDWD